MSSIDPLCGTCSPIDFKSLIYSPEDGSKPKPGIPLGTLSSIIQRSTSCQLCTLIIDALRERYKRTPPGHMSDVYYGFKVLPEPEDLTDEWADAYLDGTTPDPWKKEDVERHGIPLTWSDEPIKCTITPSFLCSQEKLGDGDKKPEEITRKNNQEEQALRVSRLIVTLSPSPWVALASSDGVKLHAVWDKPEAADGAKAAHDISPVGSGRKIGPLVEISRIKGWLHQCETEHGDQCANPAWIRGDENHEPQALRVIDVKERRVVDLPPWGRYIALSYVWGHDKEALKSRWERCLTTNNASLLKEVNGLDTIDLPQTIQDAMALTGDLGERYLWVDALCILQDDMTDLDIQTSQMDLVYSGAVLTILAACCDNSDSGLAGVPGRPRDVFHRSVRVSPDGLCLATTAALSFNQSLPSSTWNKRGWTFQERLLSRRALVFTTSQIYWLCDCSMWDEEIIFEPSTPPTWILPQALWCNDEWDDGYSKFSNDALAIYITQYSTRQLTFPSDALPAFSGIIRRYEHLNKTKTHWGLPTERFDQTLIWQFGTSRRKESHMVVLEGSITHSIPYPSWSWLGWSGFIGARIHNERLGKRTRDGDSKSALMFYSLMSDGTIRPINASDCLLEAEQSDDGGSNKIKGDPVSWKGEITISEPIADCTDRLASKISALSIETKSTAPNLPVHDTGRLVFRTSHAQAPAWFNDITDDKFFVDTGDGVLELESGLGYDELQAWDPQRSEESKIDDEVEDKVVKYPMDFIVISRFFNIGNPSETGKLNVMIVKESEDEPGVWSRIGITVVEEKDWLRMERSWKTVILA